MTTPAPITPGLTRLLDMADWHNAKPGSLRWLAANPEELDRRFLEAVNRRANDAPSSPASCKYGLCGGAGWLRHDVPVGHPLFGKGVPCQCAKDKMMQTDAERAAEYEKQVSRTERAYTLANWIGSDENARAAAKRAVDKPFGIKFFIGEYGVGKTGLLAAIFNTLWERRIEAKFYVTDKMLMELQASYSGEMDSFQRAFDALCNVRVLILDEWSAYKMTEWKDSILRTLFDHRYRYWNQLLTIIGSNEMPTNDAIDSRLSDEQACEIIRVGGRDLRPIAHTLRDEDDFWWTHEIADALGAEADERQRTAAAIR